MPKALDVSGSEFEYVLACDRELEESERTRWRMRPLTFRERLRVSDLKANANVIDYETSTLGFTKSATSVHVEVLQMGLLGVANFRNGTAEEIELRRKDGAIPDSFLERLRMEWIDELAREVLERSNVSEEVKKNS